MAVAQKLLDLPASDIADGIRSKEIDSAALYDAILQRFDDSKFAKITPPAFTPEDAKERLSKQTAESSEAEDTGDKPLRGVPIVVSDTINVKGAPTTAS